MKRLISAILALLICSTLFLTVFADGFEPDDAIPDEDTESLAPRFPYSDVGYKKWFFKYVWYVNENLLMNGMGGDIFAPNDRMTRAQFVTMLMRLCDGEEVVTDTFKDVKSKAWYAGAVGWAEKAGVVNGMTPTRFEPDEFMTRAQMATALSRFLDYIGLTELPSTDSSTDFKDSSKIDSWAKEHVMRLAGAGLIEGDAGYFKPRDNTTRAQAAALISRIDIAKKSLSEPDAMIYGAESLYTNIHGFSTESALSCDGKYPTLSVDGGTLIFDGRYFLIDQSEYHVFTVAYTGTSSSATVTLSAASGEYKASVTPTKLTIDGTEYSVVSVDMTALAGDDIETAFADTNSGLRLTISITTDAERMSVLYAGYAKSTEVLAAISENSIKEELSDKTYSNLTSYKKADDATVSKYEAQAEARISEIMSADDIDPATVKGKCYYVSSINGRDGNNGTSPNDAFASVNDLFTVKAGGLVVNTKLKAGDGVFFERGSEFFGTTALKVGSGKLRALRIIAGVTYSAYGEGEKPLFTNRLKTDTPTGKWIATEYENIWKLDEETYFNPDSPDSQAISALIVNGGEMWGIRTDKYDASHPFDTNRGIVTNGRDVFESQAQFTSLSESLKHDLQFYRDDSDGSFYMYCSGGNPSEVYDEIIFSLYGDIIDGGGSQDAPLTVVDNLAVKYGARHGMAIDGNNIVIQNCVIGWIGGRDIGNGIESWGNSENYTVKNCYLYQCYDDCMTAQYSNTAPVLMKNISFTDNVCTDATAAVELWATSGNTDMSQESLIQDCTISGNYWLRMGYGFGHQRYYEYEPNKGAKFVDCSGSYYQQFVNVKIENNVGIHSTQHIHYIQQLKTSQDRRGVELCNNTYIMGNLNTYYSRMFFSNRTDRVLYPYNARTIAYLQSLGIELGSTFYYYDGYLTQLESDTGAMH